MLPPHYPNNNPRRQLHHHHHCFYPQQEQPLLPNPTATAAAAFLMPATTTASTWDEYAGQIFPAADMYNQETLEAVLRQRVTPATMERESSAVDGDAAALAAASAAAPRRRPQRTDRHSKIRTVQGVRDRRMRLSVGVARDFFALQDRLGFDKASKTVNWLLTQSKPAIDRLCGGDAAAVPAPTMTTTVKKGKGEGMSSSTRSRGVVLDAPVMALVEDHHGACELDWNMAEAAAAAAELTQPMDGLEHYQYQYYQLQDMMRCNNGGVLPR